MFLGRESAADSEGEQNRNLSLGGFHCDPNLPLDSRHARIGLLAGLFKGTILGLNACIRFLALLGLWKLKDFGL